MPNKSEPSAARAQGVLERVGHYSGLLVFVIGAGAGFVGNEIRTNAAVEIRLRTAEGDIEKLKAADNEIRSQMVTQVQFTEVIKRLDENMARIDENVQLLVKREVK